MNSPTKRLEFSSDLSSIKKLLREKVKYMNPSLMAVRIPKSPKRTKDKSAHISFKKSFLVSNYENEEGGADKKRALNEIIATPKRTLREKKGQITTFSQVSASFRENLKEEFLKRAEKFLNERNSNQLIKGEPYTSPPPHIFSLRRFYLQILIRLTIPKIHDYLSSPHDPCQLANAHQRIR